DPQLLGTAGRQFGGERGKREEEHGDRHRDEQDRQHQHRQAGPFPPSRLCAVSGGIHGNTLLSYDVYAIHSTTYGYRDDLAIDSGGRPPQRQNKQSSSRATDHGAGTGTGRSFHHAAPEFSSQKSRDSISSRPGACDQKRSPHADVRPMR